MCTCTGKSPVLEAGLLGSSALRRLPFISRALASICGDALSEVGAVQHDAGAPRPRTSLYCIVSLAQFTWDYGRAIHAWTRPAKASTGLHKAQCARLARGKTPDKGPSNTQQADRDAVMASGNYRGTTHGARTSRTITSLLSNGGLQGDGGGGISSITTHSRDPTQGVANPLKG